MAQGSSKAEGEADGRAAGMFGLLTPQVPQDIVTRTQRQRILEAMAVSCAKKTFALTTIADIVSHAQISRGTFYKHFNNKQECFYATADRFLVDLQAAAAIAYARSEESPIAGVRDVLTVVLELLAANPEHARLLVVEAPLVDPEIVRRYRTFVIGALEKRFDAADDGSAPKADPEVAFGRAKVLIADCVIAGEVQELPALLPELLYVALLPYTGQEVALAQARVL